MSEEAATAMSEVEQGQGQGQSEPLPHCTRATIAQAR